MLTYRELVTGLRSLEIEPARPVIAHASLSAFRVIHGGADTLVGALLANFQSLMMPAFTYHTMITPAAGPPGNALAYGDEHIRNSQAEFFLPDMPASRWMGVTAETLRQLPQADRSNHPILSFTGVNVARALQAQSLAQPLAPIQALLEDQGWVLLLGVDHCVNTSIHLGERLAGRKQFIRWALTPAGVVECPGFPGCSEGFEAIFPALQPWTRRVQIGTALVQAVPLVDLVRVVQELLSADPLALLCDRSYCERCQSLRERPILERKLQPSDAGTDRKEEKSDENL